MEFSRIDISKNICNGQPRIKGSRLRMVEINSSLNYMSFAFFKETWEYFTDKDLVESINYCRTRKCVEDNWSKADFNYCDGCILRDMEEGSNYKPHEWEEVEIDGKTLVQHKFNKDETVYENWEILEQEEGSIKGWEIAEINYAKHFSK